MVQVHPGMLFTLIFKGVMATICKNGDRVGTPTIELCFFKEGMHRNCSNKPTWKLSGQSDSLRFKVCDDHLAWGIRLCGFPALVDGHRPIGQKEEETEKLFDSFDEIEMAAMKKTRPE